MKNITKIKIHIRAVFIVDELHNSQVIVSFRKKRNKDFVISELNWRFFSFFFKTSVRFDLTLILESEVYEVWK